MPGLQFSGFWAGGARTRNMLKIMSSGASKECQVQRSIDALAEILFAGCAELQRRSTLLLWKKDEAVPQNGLACSKSVTSIYTKKLRSQPSH